MYYGAWIDHLVRTRGNIVVITVPASLLTAREDFIPNHWSNHDAISTLQANQTCADLNKFATVDIHSVVCSRLVLLHSQVNLVSRYGSIG